MKIFLPFCVLVVLLTYTVCDIVSPTVEKPDVITSDTAWSDGDTCHITRDLYIESFLSIGERAVVIVDPEVIVYIGSDNVTSIVTIGKGVSFRLGEKSCIVVGDSRKPATLIAHGTEDDSIIFTRDTGMTEWGRKGPRRTYYNGSKDDSATGGILFYNTTEQTSLTYCTVEYATAGVNVNGNYPEIAHCMFANNSGNGVYLRYNGAMLDSLKFTDNTITGNGGYALSVNGNSVGSISPGNRIADNGRNGFFVTGGSLRGSSVWRKDFSPYILQNRVNIEDTLIILPGCRLEAVLYGCLRVDQSGDNGTLIARGTDDDPILFTTHGARSIYEGYGIDFYGYRTASSVSIIENCIIEKFNTGINLANSDYQDIARISNCTIRNCGSDGIVFSGGKIVNETIFTDNIVSENGGYAVRIDANSVAMLSSTNVFTGNTFEGTSVAGGALYNSATWRKRFSPYIIDGTLKVSSRNGATLTIEPGCRLEFKTDDFLQVGCDSTGTIIAEGTEEEPIVFTRHEEDGWWGNSNNNVQGGIWIGDSAANSFLAYCDIAYALTGLFIESAITVSQCSIHDNKLYGIYLSGEGLDTDISGNSYSENGVGDTYP